MTLTIETNKRSFIHAIVALCKSLGISSYKVENGQPIDKAGAIDDEAQEDAAMLHFMAEADRSQKVPITEVLTKLRAKSATQW